MSNEAAIKLIEQWQNESYDLSPEEWEELERVLAEGIRLRVPDLEEDMT